MSQHTTEPLVKGSQQCVHRPEYLACLKPARRQAAEHRLAVRARCAAATEAAAAVRREAAAAGDERLIRQRRQRRAWAAAVALALPLARLRTGVLAARVVAEVQKPFFWGATVPPRFASNAQQVLQMLRYIVCKMADTQVPMT